MKHQPEPQFQRSIEELPRDTARCASGHILEFDTDLYGNVIESCRKCQFSRPMQRVRPRSETERQVSKTEEYPCVEGCGKTVVWRRMGAKPKRCFECSQKRQREMSYAWFLRNRRRVA